MKTQLRSDAVNWAALLGGLIITALSVGAVSAQTISPHRITQDVRELSSDAYQGREPGGPGEAMVVDYIIRQLRQAGLKPAGDKVATGRSWTQDVPLIKSEMKHPPRVVVKGAGGELIWSQGQELVIRASQIGVDRVAMVDAPLVFVGYGVTAPEQSWDDFKGLDLKGKVALFLVNDPDFETGEGAFGGKSMTYYGRWTYKFEEAARRGAAGALVIHETEAAGYGWATPANSDAGPMFDVIRKNPLEQHVPVEGWIHRDAAAEVLKRAGLDLGALKIRARSREFKPAELTGVSLSVGFEVESTKVISKNVVASRLGASRPEERVIYTAHWDHLGVGRPDQRGDRIYNGAVDNAAGVALALEIARAFSDGPRTDRTVTFLFVTAEEKGLLGAEHYAANPLFPLATTAATLNIDSPSPTGPARNFSTAGEAEVSLQDELVSAGLSLGRVYAPDPLPQAGRFFRSDHFPFAKRGVPAISFKSGDDLIDGGLAAGQAWRTAYTRGKYHQPGDDWDPSWRSDGLAEDARLLVLLGRRVANMPGWPTWGASSPFRDAREKTADQRR